MNSIIDWILHCASVFWPMECFFFFVQNGRSLELHKDCYFFFSSVTYPDDSTAFISKNFYKQRYVNGMFWTGIEFATKSNWKLAFSAWNSIDIKNWYKIFEIIFFFNEQSQKRWTTLKTFIVCCCYCADSNGSIHYLEHQLMVIEFIGFVYVWLASAISCVFLC